MPTVRHEDSIWIAGGAVKLKRNLSRESWTRGALGSWRSRRRSWMGGIDIGKPEVCESISEQQNVVFQYSKKELLMPHDAAHIF
jgi:hypothetical protein